MSGVWTFSLAPRHGEPAEVDLVLEDRSLWVVVAEDLLLRASVVNRSTVGYRIWNRLMLWLDGHRGELTRVPVGRSAVERIDPDSPFVDEGDPS